MKAFKIIAVLVLALLLRTMAIDTADAADNANGRNLKVYNRTWQAIYRLYIFLYVL